MWDTGKMMIVMYFQELNLQLRKLLTSLLQALRVIRPRCRAGVRRHTGGRTLPALATTLRVVGSSAGGATGGAGGCGRGGGRCDRCRRRCRGLGGRDRRRRRQRGGATAVEQVGMCDTIRPGSWINTDLPDLPNSHVRRPGALIALRAQDLIRRSRVRVVGQPVRNVPVVVVTCRHHAARPLLLANRPVLDVIVATVDEPDVVRAAVTGDGALVLAAAGAWVVRAEVLQDVGLALLRPGVDGEVAVAARDEGAFVRDVPAKR